MVVDGGGMCSSVTRDWSVSSIRNTNVPPVWRA